MNLRFESRWPRLIGLCSIVVLCLMPVSCSLLFPPSSAEILQSGFEDLRTTANSVIGDPDRREEFLALCRQMESELLAYDEFAQGFFNSYRDAFIDHEADRKVLETLGDEFRAKQYAMQERFVALHLAMAETASPREWPHLARLEAEIIESLIDAAMESPR